MQDGTASTGTLDDHVGACLVGLERLALGKRRTESLVAGMGARAGGNEVSHTGQSHAGHGVAAASCHDAAHLGKAARHDDGERVVAKREALDHTAGNGHDVLGRSAHLDAHLVGGHVGAEEVGVEKVFEVLGTRQIAGGGDGAGGHVEADFLGMVGARQASDAIAPRELVFHNLGHELVGAVLDALGKHANG